MKIGFSITAAALSLLLFFLLFNAKSIKTEGVYRNPVLIDNLNSNGEEHTHPFGIGDPGIILHEGKYYLYPTGDNRSYDVYISSDLLNWKKGPKVFKTEERGAWAPDIFYNSSDKQFYLYYTINRRVGVAVSDEPDGNFVDKRTLVEGAIDAHMFHDDDGRYYLYYASYPGFRIFVQPMSSLTETKGKPTELISADKEWERSHVPLVEAPWMLKHKGTYYLLYSGGSADTMEYAIGYAASKSPLGPFIKHKGNPIVKKGSGIFGPGHAGVTKDLDGRLWMVYHQQEDETAGWNRIICIDPLWFDENDVLHAEATRGTPQPSPATSLREKAASR